MTANVTLPYTIGFTGTRRGLSCAQIQRLRLVLARFRDEHAARSGHVVFLHGDCIGADAEADAIAAELGIARECRPCTFGHYRAYTRARVVGDVLPPMERNRQIVHQAQYMIACPPNRTQIRQGSGTWATVRFSERACRSLEIIYPEGDSRFQTGFAIVSAHHPSEAMPPEAPLTRAPSVFPHEPNKPNEPHKP